MLLDDSQIITNHLSGSFAAASTAQSSQQSDPLNIVRLEPFATDATPTANHRALASPLTRTTTIFSDIPIFPFVLISSGYHDQFPAAVATSTASFADVPG